ncbi:MAG: carboxypeptidase regulatory-like domain-containing protein, partial [Terriglobia bacterium]
MRRLTTALIVLLWMGAPAGLQAQVDTATLVGTVRDATGAVIPSATVTATNLDTNIKTAVKSGPDGNYVITPLKISRYAVTAEANGFKTETRENIVLNVEDRLRIDFDLQVGTVSQTVEVTGQAPLVQSESSSLGDVITSQQVSELPLNGRRYTDLATLTTGVAKITEGPVNGGSTPTNGNAGGDFVANGTRGNLNNFMLDGIDNNSNDNADNVLYTSVDAIQEFKVQTATYSAEFGRSGGAVINATIKSGTNQFHGDAYEFLRNSSLDARGFFEPSDQPKAPYIQNQFGATFGGPIKKDKTFFFADYEGTRIRKAQTDIATVPTLPEQSGDFSGILGPQSASCGASGTSLCVDPLGRPIYQNEIYNPATTRTVNGSVVRDGFGFDPVTGLPIPGQANIIPTSAMNTVGLNYARLFPSPNVPGALANNFVVDAPGSDRIDQMDARIDQNISPTSQLFGRFSLSQRTRFQAPVFLGIADGGNYST